MPKTTAIGPTETTVLVLSINVADVHQGGPIGGLRVTNLPDTHYVAHDFNVGRNDAKTVFWVPDDGETYEHVLKEYPTAEVGGPVDYPRRAITHHHVPHNGIGDSPLGQIPPDRGDAKISDADFDLYWKPAFKDRDQDPA